MIQFNSTEKISLSVLSFLMLSGVVFSNWSDLIAVKKELSVNVVEVIQKPVVQNVEVAVSVTSKKLISINKTDLQTLITIKGIGKVTAQRILDYRQQNGNFKNLGELIKIKGIGPKKIKKILPKVCL